MRPARWLLFLMALWAGAGLFVALPTLAAHADELQQCRLVAGRLVMSPGLTNVPTDQTITAHGRFSGCSTGGGSGAFAATIHSAQATCATFANTLLPADVALGWNDGESAMASVTFVSPPGSPNKVLVTGRVISGAALGSRVGGGLRMSVLFRPIIANPAHGHSQKAHKQERVPLDDKAAACSWKSPQSTILISNFEGFTLQARAVRSAPVAAAHPKAPASTRPPVSAVSSTTAATTTTAPPTTTSRRNVARGPAKKTQLRKVAVGDLGEPRPSSSGSFTNPESLLGAGVATGTLCGCGLLFFRRARLVRRRPRRLIR